MPPSTLFGELRLIEPCFSLVCIKNIVTNISHSKGVEGRPLVLTPQGGFKQVWKRFHLIGEVQILCPSFSG